MILDHSVFVTPLTVRAHCRSSDRLQPPRRSTSRSYRTGQTEIDVIGWELKHACALALASNPTVLDALRKYTTNPLLRVTY